ncbi:MAG: DUF4178 domain-containing protein [Burkholderiaceae bacterium]
MATDSLQRSYRAPCPSCGAPVEFRSAQSTHAVCGYCQSTVVRSGDTLARTGKMSELFDDFSPLQLMASGKWDGKPFTLIGRLQYKYAQGTWSEWIAGFDDGSTGSLSEDNGAFVFSTALATSSTLPAATNFVVGKTTAINGKSFTVAANNTVSLLSAQGELPKLPALGTPFEVVELRGDQGDVISIDYYASPPAVSSGRAVLLEDLQLKGLKDEQAKSESGQQFACPNCAASLQVTLSSTKSLTCRSCHSIIDVSQGVAGQLSHALQTDPVAPLIALGSTGQLQGVAWQLVGFQHRMGTEADDPDEHFGWTEYLLYNQKRGFTFLVDSTEGWSLATPTTGAPTLSSNGAAATYLGNTYNRKYSYKAETQYVAGEFYWRVERGQLSNNTDFEKGAVLLSREETPNEVTWSMGSKLSSAAVAKSFKLKDGALDGGKDALKTSDAKPLSSIAGMGCGTIVILILILLLFLFLISRCSNSVGTGRSSGGSYGGFSSGGGHK